ncbi:amino acid permease [Bombilactobacillus thymidiniphilus]|uniref:Amino acid permease n=1 Tax=Bombilactobacillus thymidiniphilus TaxID=2923363 RepID=A0ABY4PEK2_9LACO|nr:amino acid permease [Bombilactobacillus thymidiniphilus]UQS84155.1 amino acid permease [Bombilactobacillus thymidiniphilus]
MSDKPALARNLSTRHVNMIALGGTIGTGLFLGSGESIKQAGPLILVIYLITGLFIFFMMRALGELLMSDTNKIIFIDFITEYLGPRAGFVLGWTYWAGWIVIAMSELTAVGNYMQFWFPKTPAWIWEAIFLILLYTINIIAVKAFGETEFWFALIKIIAIITIIVSAIIMVILHTKTNQGIVTLSNLWQHGISSGNSQHIIGSFQMAFFSFLGVEFVGVSAAETKNPRNNIPRAINSVIMRILIFYIGALSAIMIIQPWTHYSATRSPFVQVFAGIGIQGAAGIINFVVLTAAASSLNSSLFTTGRMLYSMCPQNSYFAHLNKQKIPMRTITLSTVLVASVIVVNYLFANGVFKVVTSIASAGFLVIYMFLMLTHIKYRHSADYLQGDKYFSMPGAPMTDYLTIVFMLIIFIILIFAKATLIPTILTLIWLGIIFLVSLCIKFNK